MPRDFKFNLPILGFINSFILETSPFRCTVLVSCVCSTRTAPAG